MNPLANLNPHATYAPTNGLQKKNHWLSRHVSWIKLQLVSDYRIIRFFAKMWAVVLPILFKISIVFSPYANRVSALLKQNNKFEFLSKEVPPGEITNEGIEKELLRISESMLNHDPFSDGNCDNFLREEIFRPYLVQIKSFLNHYPTVKLAIEKLKESPFKNSILILHSHLQNAPKSYSFENNRNYYNCILQALRHAERELKGYSPQTDDTFVEVRAFSG